MLEKVAVQGPPCVPRERRNGVSGFLSGADGSVCLGRRGTSRGQTPFATVALRGPGAQLVSSAGTPFNVTFNVTFNVRIPQGFLRSTLKFRETFRYLNPLLILTLNVGIPRKF